MRACCGRLYAVAALSFATTLTLPYVGEEGIYTIAAMEMKARGEYFINTLYGTNHGQPPLLNWLVIPLADLIGWQHVLVASRLVAACATIATGLVLAWLVAALTQDARFAAFAALVYLTSDALHLSRLARVHVSRCSRSSRSRPSPVSGSRPCAQSLPSRVGSRRQRFRARR